MWRPFVFLFLYFQLSSSQTAQFVLDTPTTATFTTESLGSNANWYLDSNGRVPSAENARMVGNGYISQGNTFSCTRKTAPPITTLDVSTDFTVDLWVYINDPTKREMFVCEYYDQAAGMGTSSNWNQRWCIGHDNNREVSVYMNKDSVNGNYNLDYQSINNLDVDAGWNHITMTFTRTAGGGGRTDVVGYLQSDAGSVRTGNWRWNDQLDNQPNSQLCTGAYINNYGGNNINDEFSGVLNEVKFYNSALTAAQVSALYSTNCQSYCTICKIQGAAPYQCLQQRSGYIAKYDFDQVIPYATTIPDNSGKGNTIPVDPNFSFTPIFVHNEGLCFDKTWAGMNQNVDFDGQNQDDQIGWNNGAEDSEWHYLAVSIRATSATQSEVCIKLSDRNIDCNNLNRVFTDDGGMTMRVGSNFDGCMKNLYFSDYAKVERDMEIEYGSACTNWNTKGCLFCPRSTNFKCISDCPTNTQGTQCTYCYSNCRSCWGVQYNQCYSCFSGWTFDYIGSCLSTCGDSIKDDVEDCEDGNVVNGDGCSSTCKTEAGYICFGGSFNQIILGVNTFYKDTCYEKCGDGINYSKLSTVCDDGNLVDGDGCDKLCNVETGYTCAGSPSKCTTVCGDGMKMGAEACDDSNLVNSDGCSSTCTVEVQYTCTDGQINKASVCTEVCGDSKDMGKLACEDGNNVQGDGCNPVCAVEVGFTSCSGGTTTTIDSCTPTCGDGRKFAAEKCDDGNTANSDGCSSTCTIETGYSCAYGDHYNNDYCTEKCGDGLKMGVLACDDGNAVSGDGCSSSCEIEVGFICYGGSPTVKDICYEPCGDGRNAGSYACDDGNALNGDGCSSKCVIEKSWTCSKGDLYSPSVCTKPCDGLRDFWDMCDDGNIIGSDGCDQCCQREIGYGCTGGSSTSKDTCTEVCGDGRKMNINACDDGNTKSGDGCAANCIVEKGFTCTGGTFFNPDICTETCGDGLNMGKYQCDDGNNNNQDGCSSSCYVENGFVCSGGSSSSKDVCVETCGDGKNFGINECDDGGLINGDGCSSKCKVEAGWKCSQGNAYTPDICYEICGDGKKVSKQISCDDGNAKNGDGCSDFCSIETGWVCYGGTSTTPDKCYQSSSPTITSAYFTRDNKQIILNFNESVYMMPQWDLKTSWALDMNGPFGKGNYIYSWNVTNQMNYKTNLKTGTKQMIIDFNSSQQFFGNKLEQVRIDFTERQLVRGTKQKVQMQNYTALVFPYGQEDLSDTTNICGFPVVMGTLTESMIYASYAFGFLGALFGISMSDTWGMMITLQIIYLFPILNLQMPSCLTRFVWRIKPAFPESDFIALTMFDGSTSHNYTDEYNAAMGWNYEKMGLESTAILRSGADILSLGVYMFIINIILEILHITLNSQFLKVLMERFKGSAYNSFLQFALIKISLLSQVNVKNISALDGQTSLSSLISIVLICGCYGYFFYICYQSFHFYKEVKAIQQLHKEEEEQKAQTIKKKTLAEILSDRSTVKKLTSQEIRDKTFYRGVVLFEDISISLDKYPYSILYPLSSLAKRLILTAMVSTNNQDVQLLGFLIIHVMSLTAIYLSDPFDSPILGFQSVVNEMLLFLVFMQSHRFIPRSTVDLNSMLKDSQAMVFLILVVVWFNAMIVILSKIALILKCRNFVRAKKEQVKVHVTVDLKDQISQSLRSMIKQNETTLANQTQPNLSNPADGDKPIKNPVNELGEKSIQPLNTPSQAQQQAKAVTPQQVTAPNTPNQGQNILNNLKAFALQNALSNNALIVTKQGKQNPSSSKFQANNISEESKSEIEYDDEEEEFEITQSYEEEEDDEYSAELSRSRASQSRGGRSQRR